MSGQFRRAIARIPAETYPQGLTSAVHGVPDLALTRLQHRRYCEALQTLSLEVILLEADDRFPDSTFVEDTAVLTPKCAILTNPGAESRKGEVAAIKDVLERYYDRFFTITPPGTLDGGDICEAGDHYFIGISERTNEEGARQLADFLGREGYTSAPIDLRGLDGILHLKSGIAYLGENNLVLIDAFYHRKEFEGYHRVAVHPQERYAANCIRVTDAVFLASGFPRLRDTIATLGYSVVALDMSEFQKMDGGLSCLSLRF